MQAKGEQEEITILLNVLVKDVKCAKKIESFYIASALWTLIRHA